MPLPEPPPAVLTFIADHIRTLDELGLLVALIQSGDRWWDARGAARELGVPERAAAEVLDSLATRNLLDIRITDDVRYQFRPGTPELEDAARAFAAAYRLNPLAVVQAVTQRDKAPARRS
jgi:hypothetical protein